MGCTNSRLLTECPFPFQDRTSDCLCGCAAVFDPAVIGHHGFPDQLAGETAALRRRAPALEWPDWVVGAVPVRQLEFYVGRRLALRCLTRLDAGLALGCSPDRGPVWPEGTVGSVTHDVPRPGAERSAMVCVAAARGPFRWVGLDSESWMSAEVAREIAGQAAHPDELRVAGSTLGWEPARLLTLVFSAKEALFKATARSLGRFIDFHDAALVRVTGSRRHGRFTLVLANPGPLPTHWNGEYRASPDRLHTLIAA